jgi:hypothetical protein
VKGRHPTRPSRPSAAHFFDVQFHHGQGDEKQASKAKKFLKPSKEGVMFIYAVVLIDFQLFTLCLSVLGLLEQQMKDKERRKCHVCKKTESGHRQTYITCAECLKSNFPKTKHFCSKICESK